MAVVNVLPLSLLILAIISVFKVGDSISSSNTTILLIVGTLEAVKAFEAINVVCARQALPVINTYPS